LRSTGGGRLYRLKALEGVGLTRPEKLEDEIATWTDLRGFIGQADPSGRNLIFKPATAVGGGDEKAATVRINWTRAGKRRPEA